MKNVRFRVHIERLLNYMKAIPRLTMLVEFLAVLTIASAIGRLHYSKTITRAQEK
jgi:hypothetical protein